MILEHLSFLFDFFISTYFKLIMQREQSFIKYYKCLSRINPSSSSISQPNSLYQYTLHSYARTNFFIIDIYHLYFIDIKKKTYYSSSNLQIISLSKEQKLAKLQKNISLFFQTFCQHVFLHSLLGQQQKKTQFVSNLMQDMMGKSNDFELFNIIKNIFIQGEEKYQQLFIQPGKQRSWKDIKFILSEIDNNVQQMINKIKSNSKIVQEEYFPQITQQKEKDKNKEIQYLILYSRNMFERIKNIHILRRSKRKYMLQMFQQEHSNINPLNHVKNSSKQQNKIYLSKNEKEDEPMNLPLKTFLKNIKNRPYEINLAIAKDIIIMLTQFLRQQKRPYPNLKIKSLFMNQKQLKPSYQQAELILDAIGLSGNTNTIETQLAFSPTPIGLEYQKCHLQYLQQGNWLLIKKYFSLKNTINQQQQQPNKLKQNIFSHKEINEKTIEENIHVWRLLCILYLIFNCNVDVDQLSVKIYNKDSQNLPFHFSRYKKVLQKTYKNILHGKMKLSTLLNIQKMHKDKDEKTDNFNFTMNEICEYFDVVDLQDDSILQNLKFQSFCAELHLRITFAKEIFNIMLNDRFFKKIINSKKYIITFFIHSIEFYYQSAFKVWIQQKKSNSRKKLIITLQKYNKMPFQQQRQKRKTNLQIVYDKLIEYTRRKDQHQKYLSTQVQIIEIIKKMYQNIQKLNKMQYELNESELMAKNVQLSTLDQQKYKQIFYKIKQLSTSCFNICIFALQSYFSKEFQMKMDRLQQFHKIQQISKEGKYNRQIATIANYQLLYFIKSYNCLQHYNWKVFNNLILYPLLESRKNTSSKSSKKPIELLQKEQLDQILSTLKVIGTKIDGFKVKDLNFNDNN